jgi:hypothetical protein
VGRRVGASEARAGLRACDADWPVWGSPLICLGQHARAGRIAGPTNTVCSDRYCQSPDTASVPAETLFPLALHEQACPTSRCGLRRLGCDPGVECIYTTVDVAAAQLNDLSWIHRDGTSRLHG